MAKHFKIKILTNTSYINSIILGNRTNSPFVRVKSNANEFIFKAISIQDIKQGNSLDQLKNKECTFSPIHRKLLNVDSGDEVEVLPVNSDDYPIINSLTIYLYPIYQSKDLVNLKIDDFTKIFHQLFDGLIITKNFQLIAQINHTDVACHITELIFDQQNNKYLSNHGRIVNTTAIHWSKSKEIEIVSKPQTKPLFNQVVDSSLMNIGGLTEELQIIFRRLFASRLLPTNVLKEMGIRHVRGVIIYGPPGCGKTLLARQICKLLNCEHPKIVNGPELLNKYVGESESNVRKLFEPASDDIDKNNLHVIICDEFDALCRHRGFSSTSTIVHDNIVNTFLSYLDGINPLDNILFICMTNRFDLIDPAMLRPGRLDLQIELRLPTLEDRKEIFIIHTREMNKHKYLDHIDFNQLAQMTDNFTGAEIEGVVKNATSIALERQLIDKNGGRPIIKMNDFIKAISETKPMFGGIHLNLDQIEYIDWDCQLTQSINKIIEETRQLKKVSVALTGQPYSGKKTFAYTLIKKLHPNYARLIDFTVLSNKSDYYKVSFINQIFIDSQKSTFSGIILDSFERLIEWSPVGPQYNNQVFQTIVGMIQSSVFHGCHQIIILTCSEHQLLDRFEIKHLFDFTINLDKSITPEQAKLFNINIPEPLPISKVLRYLN